MAAGKAAVTTATKVREAVETAALRRECFYHGPFPRENVEGILAKDGEFMLRYNDKERARGFVVSVRWSGSIRHFKVNAHTRDISYYIRKDKAFPTIKELVEHHWKQGTPLVEKECKDGLIRLKDPAPRDRWELKAKDVVMQERIGQGAFGEVWKARFVRPPLSTGTGISEGSERERTRRGTVDKKTQKTRSPSLVREVAVKTCKDKTTEGKAKFEKEAMFQLKFKHKNIVETVGIVVSEEPMMIVLEYMPRGSLLSYLQRGKGRLTAARLKTFCLDAARGLEYLERLHCIHRDVATRNCLVGTHEEVKISDFGLAKSQEKYKMLVGKVAIKWMAPESMRNGDFTSKSDVWSYGVLMWEVFSHGAEPYPGMTGNEVKRKVLIEKYKMEPPRDTPPLFAETMGKCWEQAPRDRPAFSTILRTLDKGLAPSDSHDHTDTDDPDH